MLNPDLEQEFGWAIAALRDAFGPEIEIEHTDRGRGLFVRARGQRLRLYEAPRDGPEYSLNREHDRWSVLQSMIDAA